MSDPKPLNLDAHLGKVKNRVALVGVELEGGWKQLPPGIQALERDGSVFNDRMPAGAKYIGELPLGPMMPSAVAEMVRTHYPQLMNSTCGMHVHMSFDSLWYYQALMVPEYQESVLHYLTKWAEDKKFKPEHNIWPRLRSESRFCQKKFWPDAQASKKQKGHDQTSHGHRYTHVHYCGRPGMNTIEIRTLPMMESVKLAVEAIHKVIQITNASLFVLGASTKRNKTAEKISLPNNMVYEETVIEEI